MKRIIYLVGISVGLGIFSASQYAYAFRLSPMVSEFSPQGKQATQTFVVENPGKDKIAIQLEIAKRKIDLEGKEDRTEVSDEFVVYPEQLSLDPGEKRSVRVTYTGEQKLNSEKAYRLIASQLPITLKKPSKNEDVKVNLKFILQYVASIYIIPEDVKPKIVVDSIKKIDKEKFELVVKNEGTSHKLLENAKVSLFDPEKKEEAFPLDEKELKTLQAENILVDGRRKFTLKLPKPLSEKANIGANISFE